MTNRIRILDPGIQLIRKSVVFDGWFVKRSKLNLHILHILHILFWACSVRYLCSVSAFNIKWLQPCEVVYASIVVQEGISV